MKRLLTTMLVGLAGIQGVILADDLRPKLVVGIIIDQLRTDQIENLKEMFGAGGFRRLMDQGVYIQDIDFKMPAGDVASASALVQTGAYPRVSGITGTKVFNSNTRTLEPIYIDKCYIGNFTNETFSPVALRANTLSDILSVEENGKTKVHAISPDAAGAITMAGHTGNSAFWVNDETGSWSSTTYYTGLPGILQEINYVSPLVSRLDTIKWTPLRPGLPYPNVASSAIKQGFKYTFSRSDRDVFELYKTSPFINADITKAATKYIEDLNLGHNPEGTDVLNLIYNLSPTPMATGGESRYALEDAYLRLDRDLETLFNVIDRKVGKDNALIYLVSTGYFVEPEVDVKSYRLPGGTFSVKRALSLLNAYLAAKYGNGSYVDHYAGSQIYLNKKEIETKNLDLNNIASDARDFLVRMSGVTAAYTMADLVSPALAELEGLRQSIDPKTSGDIVLEFSEGWNVTDDSRFPVVQQVEKSTSYLFPAFIYGAGLQPKKIDDTVEAAAIAPTIASLLHIRSPNSAKSKPLLIK